MKFLSKLAAQATMLTVACSVSAQELKIIEIAPPTRLCEEGEPRLIITPPENHWRFKGWESENLWTFSVESEPGIERNFGWIDGTNPSDIFISSYSIEGDHLEAHFVSDEIAETVTVSATLTTPQGATPPVTSVFTFQQFENLAKNYFIDECDENLAIVGEATERPIPFLIAGIITGAVWALKVSDCVDDTNTQWRDGRAACNNAFPFNSPERAQCLACADERAIEDRGNCITLNGPDDDYDNCITNIPQNPN